MNLGSVISEDLVSIDLWVTIGGKRLWGELLFFGIEMEIGGIE